MNIHYYITSHFKNHEHTHHVTYKHTKNALVSRLIIDADSSNFEIPRETLRATYEMAMTRTQCRYLGFSKAIVHGLIILRRQIYRTTSSPILLLELIPAFTFIYRISRTRLAGLMISNYHA